MNYIKKFSEYCESIINSKIIEIPNKKLPQTIRQQEYMLSCKAMKMYLKETFLKEGENIEKQAKNENIILTLEQLREMQQIGDDKIKKFLEISNDKFSEL